MPVSIMQNVREVAAAQAAQARGAAQEAAQQARVAAQEARTAAEDARDIARTKLEAAKAEREAQRIGTEVGVPDRRDRESNEWIAIPVMGIFSTAAVVITAMVLRYRVKMRGASSAALPPDLTDRLSRMEAGIDAMAVEVERISEGQRFTTRLLSERPVEEVRRG